MTAPTTGWIGFGFAESGTMKDADIIMAGVEDGGVYIIDAYADKNEPPSRDNDEDVEWVDYDEKNGKTSVTFSRRLDTRDSQDYEIEEGLTRVIWAYGEYDLDGDPTFQDSHRTNSGSKRIELIPPEDERWDDGDDDDGEVRNRRRNDDRDDRNFDDTEELDDDVKISWRLEDDEIVFKMTAPTTGWIGFGFSEYGNMEDADIIIFGVEDGDAYIFDAHSDEDGPPTRDHDDDVEWIDFDEKNGKTSVTFSRKLDTRDSQDHEIEEGLTRVIWAYGEHDLDGKPSSRDYHRSNRGSMRLEIIPPGRGGGRDDDDDDVWEDSDREERRRRERRNRRRRNRNQDSGWDDDEDEDENENFDKVVVGHGEEFLNWENTIHLRWLYDADTISFKLTAPTRGWIGFGISRTKDMTNADLAMVGVHKGKSYIIDLNSKKNGVPKVDRNQDYEIMSAFENSTHTSVSFKRDKKTNDDFEIREGSYNVIWAYGGRDLIDLPSVKNYHGPTNRGWTKTEFIPKIMKWKREENEGNYDDEKQTSDKSKLFRLSLPLNTTLDEEREVKLFWVYDKTHIILKVTAPTLGWIGIGFSGRRSMVDSDLIMMGVRDNGKPYVLDLHARTNGIPDKDQTQDIILLQASENDTHTTVIIARSRDTKDGDDINIQGGMIYVLWAFSRFDLNVGLSRSDYHRTTRGYKLMNLIVDIPEGSIVELPPPPEKEDIADYFDDGDDEDEESRRPINSRDDDDDDDEDDDDDDRRPRGGDEKQNEDGEIKPFVEFLDDKDDVWLRWNHDGDDIIINIAAPTKGWVGVGFSPDGTMKDADIAIGGLYRDKRYLHDAHSEENGTPKLDDSDDLEALYITENGTHTTVVFRRKHNTRDSNDFKIEGGKIHVIWAFGEDDMPGKPDNDFNHHRNRGSKEVILRPDEPDPGDRKNERNNNGGVNTRKSDRVVRRGRQTAFNATAGDVTTNFNAAWNNDDDDNEDDDDQGSPVIRESDGSYSTYMDENKKYHLQWIKRGDEAIVIKMTSKTLGWVGFGIGFGKTMRGADLNIAGITRQGNEYIYDTFASENGVPDEDEFKDLKILSARENETHTIAVFERDLDTFDRDDNVIKEGKLNVLWAYGELDVESTIKDDDLHDARGVRSLELLKDDLGNYEDGMWDEDKDDISESTDTEPDNGVEHEEDQAASVIRESDGSYSTYMDEDNKYHLQWIKKGARAIVIKMTAKTSGWVGFGIGLAKTMRGADLNIAGITRRGEKYIYDTYASENGIPNEDEFNDLEILSAKENETHTIIVFERDLNTFDAEDNVIEEGKLNIFWAYGELDVESTLKEDDYHYGARGVRVLELLQDDLGDYEDVEWGKDSDISEPTDPVSTPREPGEPIEEYLDSEKTVKLVWQIEDGEITLQIKAPTNGWVGIGISDDSSLEYADFFIGGAVGDNDYIFDVHGDGSGDIFLDDSQDVELMLAYEKGEETSVVFKRKLTASDRNDHPIEGGIINVIWAYGDDDISKDDLSNLKFKRQGFKGIVLIPGTEGQERQKRPRPDPTVSTALTETTALDERQLSAEQKFKHTYLDGNEQVQLGWNVKDDDITLKVVAPTSGWVGIGISLEGSMKGADMFVAGIDDGDKYVFDTHGTENGVPVVDNSQDVELLMAFEDKEATTVVFRRMLKADDPNDISIRGGKLNIIWAYGQADMIREPALTDYHMSNKGSKLVQLVAGDDNLGDLGARTTQQPSVGVFEEETTTAEYEDPGTVSLDEEKKMKIHWTITDEDIIMKVTASTLGWVGIGFSPDGTMEGADLMIAGIKVDKEYVFDAHAEFNGIPDLDKSNDIDLLNIYEENGKTIFVSRRRLDTADPDDMRIQAGNMHVIWALGDNDIDDKLSTSDYHFEKRGSKVLQLIAGEETTTTPATTTLRTTTKTSTINPNAPKVIALDEKGEVTLEWSVEGRVLLVQMIAPSLGWLGIGFSEDEKRAGADLVVAGFGEEGDYLHDAHFGDDGVPVMDKSQDPLLIIAYENETYTTIYFEKDLVSLRDDDDVSIKKDMYVLWEYGKEDFTSFDTYKPVTGGIKLVRLNPAYKERRVVEVTTAPKTTTPYEVEETTAFEEEQDDGPGVAFLDEDKTVQIRWTVTEGGPIIEIAAPTFGWIGIGFSSNGKLDGSDFIVAGVSYVYDAHITGNTVKLDESQDAQLLLSDANDTHSRVVIQRTLVATDVNDVDIKSGTILVLWALGQDTMENGFDGALINVQDIEQTKVKIVSDDDLVEETTMAMELPLPMEDQETTTSETKTSAKLNTTLAPLSTSILAEVKTTRVEAYEAATTPEKTTRVALRTTAPFTATTLAKDTTWTVEINATSEYTKTTTSTAISTATTTTPKSATSPTTSETSAATAAMTRSKPSTKSSTAATSTTTDTPTSKTVATSPTTTSKPSESSTTAATLTTAIAARTPKPTKATTTTATSTMTATTASSRRTTIDPMTSATTISTTTKASMASSTTTAMTASEPEFTATTTGESATTGTVTSRFTTTTSSVPTKTTTAKTTTSMRSKTSLATSSEKAIFPHSRWLDTNQTVLLSWASDKENIILQMCAPTKGWIGLGFSPHGTMVKSNMFVTGVKENDVYIVDAHAKKNGIPRRDDSQDVNVLFFSENNTHTTVVVQRKLDTGDGRDTIITENEMHVIWAYGRKDIRKVPRKTNYHGQNRGAAKINFFEESENGSGMDYKGFMALTAAFTLLFLLYNKLKG